ncbi:carboxypeptidase-like regulatory domain-containing protein [bacterium]|nr:carboxypeptidase-like regulatory domain-containing protein [bacterium]
MLSVSIFLGQDHGSDIRGRVIDSKTKDPVYFADVFISNTTIGSATATDGTFKMNNIAPGCYKVVVHHIAYQTKVLHVNLLKEKTVHLAVELVPRVLSGKRIEIVAEREKLWQKHFQEFRKAFLGKTENAKYCHFYHPEVIDFTVRQGWLYASTDSLIRIRNQALGYDISLILENFRCGPNQIKYQIYPVFRPMPVQALDDSIRWVRQRQKTYLGSFRHFLRAAYHQSLDQEGLELYEVKQVGNKIYTWGSTDRVGEDVKMAVKSDFPGLKSICLKGHYMLLSHHIPRKTDKFVEQAQKADFYQLEFYEPCFFNMNCDMALIDPLGNVHTPHAFSVSGHWSVCGVADMLPFEYQPDDSP